MEAVENPHWDADLAAATRSFEEDVVDVAVQELDAEIEALQEMDAAAARRALYLDGDV